VAASDPATAERTQIVLQWLFDPQRSAAMADLDMTDIWNAEDILDREGADLFEVDGHDIGKRAANVFLFAADPEAAVTRILAIVRHGLLREGMRIGVALDTDTSRKKTYRAVFPPGIEKFEIVL
jgi:hypothetical protein